MKATELQQIARTENYAIFQLKSMLGNLVHVNRVDDRGVNFWVQELRKDIECCITAIQGKQIKRKYEREHPNG